VLKQRSEFFQSLMMLNDLFFLSVAWWLAYLIRFETDFFPEPEPHLLPHYIIAWLIILIVWTAVFHWLDFYRPRRLSGQKREIVEVLKGCSLAMLIFLGVLFLLRGVVLSRIVVIVFGVSSFIVLNISHVVFREGLRFLRRRGYNLRHVLLIGTPRQVDQLLHKLRAYRQFGLNIAGVYLTQEAPAEMTPVPGGCLNDTAKQEPDSQKNQHRETAPLEHLDDFAVLTGQSAGTIKIQPVKNRRPDDQDNKPCDDIVRQKMRLGLREKICFKAEPIGEPPRDAQKEEVVQHHQALEEFAALL